MGPRVEKWPGLSAFWKRITATEIGSDVIADATRTTITRKASRCPVQPPSQRTRHSPNREPIVTGVFQAEDFGKRRK
jgi:hypothetical protein